MKIFNTKEIYEADKFTLVKQQISADDLMERAAIQVFNWMHTRLAGNLSPIHVFCGVGNNGGDGLVLARHLHQYGYRVAVHIIEFSGSRSAEFSTNLDRLRDVDVCPNFLDEKSKIPDLEKEAFIVDAIFGIGLKRDVAPWVIKIFQEINRSKALVLSVDIPSGLFMEHKVPETNAAIKANYVLSFQVPKLIFFLPGTGVFMDHWELLDIGLDKDFLLTAPSDYELIGRDEVLAFYRPREKFSHKGTYGHVLIVGGSYGKMGAVVLASKGGLYSGSGLVTAFVPKCGYVPLQSAFPELMVLTDTNETEITDIVFDIVPTVIGIGVGMGTGSCAVQAFAKFLKNNKTPLVIDADGLNILSRHPELFSDLPPKTVLTPHPKELERMLGKWENDFDKLKKTKKFSKKYDCVVVIKGAHTITVYGDKGYVNTTGNPGMATGGSGDVLTGVITGLLAQGYPTLEAAIFGVYLHGRAADMAIGECGCQALVATDIINALGKAYWDLLKDGLVKDWPENG